MLIGYHKISSLAIKLDDVISMIFQASKVFVVIFFFGCYIYIIRIYTQYLVGGIPTPLKNMKVSWDYYSQYMGK